ncbi:STAS domain-containing protein [Actinoplanes sp. NPDC023714]|uniref:STAS domain-containing protein n=1 Tax=Actinoplanes sp. NPDC023714 TaxID=3154322 RepID=UPI0033E0B760
MTDFQISTAPQAGRIVVSVAGDVDLRHRDEMTDSLQAAVRSAPEVVVDLAAVRFLDSSGLHALISARQAATRRDGTVWVVNATGTVAMVLEMTGVLKLLRPPATPGTP